MQYVNIEGANGQVTTVKEGDWISLNGTTGEVISGKQECKEPELSGNLATLML